MAEKLPPQPQLPQSVSNNISEVMRRLRLLEERYSGLRKKTQFTEQNMLRESKELSDDIRLIKESITDVKSMLAEMNEKLLKLKQEVDGAVQKSEFNVIAKYIEFWQPLNFLTREEAKKIINQK